MLALYPGTASLDQLIGEFLNMAPPKSAEEMLNRETEHRELGQELQDLLTFNQLQKAHQDKDFVRGTVAAVKGTDPRPLKNMGWKKTSVQLEGGRTARFKTPYLAVEYPEPTRKRQHKQQRLRGKGGTGRFPVLEALGLTLHATPLVQREATREMVRAQSYQEASSTLASRGLEVDVKTLIRWTQGVGNRALAYRTELLSEAMTKPVPNDGVFAGKRLLISEDGGRARLRYEIKRGRRRKSGRHGFTTEWKEPKGFVIYILDEDGELDRDYRPFYESTLGNADAILELLIGYLRLHGAKYAAEILVVADGAEWIWNRVAKLIEKAELEAERVFKLVDFYHASEYLTKAKDLCRYLSKAQKDEFYGKLKGYLALGQIDKLVKLLEPYVEEKPAEASSGGGKEPKDPMQGIINYFVERKELMRYREARDRKLPIGSGAMESAIRRVVNMRFKGPGLLWKPENLEPLLHLRAQLKSGWFNEMFLGLLRHEQLALKDEFGTVVQHVNSITNQHDGQRASN